MYPATDPVGAVHLGVKDVLRRSVISTPIIAAWPGSVEETGTVIEAVPVLTPMALVVAVKSTLSPSGTVAPVSVALLVVPVGHEPSATILAEPIVVTVVPTVAVKVIVALEYVAVSTFVQTLSVPCQPVAALLSGILLAPLLPVAVKRLEFTGVCQLTDGGGVSPTVTSHAG